MGDCYLDDCKKKEWLRLRKLRLQQVRNASKDVAEEVRRRTKEKQAEKSKVLKVRKERIFQEYKKMKCEELEKKYYEAMEKLGFAHTTAQYEPNAEQVLQEHKAKNDRMSAVRGKAAQQKQLAMMEAAKEKENAPIRRKELTRDVEDIRAGLAVQCHDWATINKAMHPRQILLDIPVTNVTEFKPREPMEPLPVRPVAALLTPSPKRRVSLSPKSPVTPQSRKPYNRPELKSPQTPQYRRPYNRPESKSPLQSPVVPRLSGISASSRSATTKSPERPVLDFYSRPHYGPTVYNTDPPQEIQELLPSSDDEELSYLLKKYATVKPTERTPPKTARLKQTARTPPTRGDDYSLRQPIKRKSMNRPKVSSRSETKKLFKAVDKALEEGRQLLDEVSQNGSYAHNSNSDESDDDAVVQLIVNVNCGQNCGDDNKMVPVVEKVNRYTEVGHSLDENEKPQPQIRMRVKQFKACRSSTLEDSSQDETDDCGCNDESSIYDFGNSSSWSSTDYFTTPEKLEVEGASFKYNALLDYYVTKLLGQPSTLTDESTDYSGLQCCSSGSISEEATEKKGPISPVDWDGESAKRIEKISELKKVLEQIREEKTALEISATSVSPESSANQQPRESGGSKDRTIREEVQPPAVEPPVFIMPDDLMAEIMRRGLVSKPFVWNTGEPLTGLETEPESTTDSKNATADVTFSSLRTPPPP